MKIPEFFDPTEFQSAAVGTTGWWAASTGLTLSTSTVRKINGVGGTRSFHTGNNPLTSPQHPNICGRIYIKFGYYKTFWNGYVYVYIDDNIGYQTYGWYINYSGNNAHDAYTTPGAVLITRGRTYDSNRWYLLEAMIDCPPNGSYVTLVQKVDGIQVFSGSLADGLGVNINKIRLTVNSTALIDDFEVNALTLSYVGGSSFAPSVGNTITDGTTGALASVASVDGDGTSGRLYLYEWNNIDFGDGNTITESGTSTTALVNAPTPDYVSGFEPNSLWIGNRVIMTPVVPTGSGTTTGLTPSAGSNWQTVDEVPYSDADYNYATAAGQYDTYTQNFGTVVTSSVVAIDWVGVSVRGRSDLAGIDGAQGVLRYNGTDYSGSRQQLPSSDAYITPFGWDTAPDGTGALTRDALTGSEFGVKLVT